MNAQDNLKDIFTQAMTELVNANYLKSIALLTEVLVREPKHKLALTARGSAFLRQGNIDRALADFDRAIDAYPDYARAFHLRAIARSENGDDAGAMADLDRAIAIDPEYGAAYYSRANVHSKAGRDDAAGEDAAMATQIGLHNMERYSNGNNVWRTGHFAFEDAMETELMR